MTSYLAQYQKVQKRFSKKNSIRPCPGEVWFASNVDGIKDRPILIFSVSGDHIACKKCTSRPNDIRRRVLIEDYINAGLEKDTYVDPEPKTLLRSDLLWKMGSLSEDDRRLLGFQ